MKRPEGFDPSPEPRRPSDNRAGSSGSGDSGNDGGRLAALRGLAAAAIARRRSAGVEDGEGDSPKPTERTVPTGSPAGAGANTDADTGADTDAGTDERQAKRDLRRAEARRRRFERSEVRRFTRRTRRRRITLATIGAVVAVLLGMIAVAVYSPLLALKTIEIDGTSRIDPAALHDAIDEQLDTPLALIDFDEITESFRSFPLIKSYVTETIPPDTLVIHIVERQPIGALPDGSGFTLVDPAGIVVERSEARIEGVPLIDIGSAGADTPAFAAAVEVLLALPDSVLSRLDTVTASTKDDVSLTLAGDGARIIWGSADRSDYKARVLAAALENDFPGVTEYNVSAPGQLTYR